jgi:hypothetical protein
MRYLLPLLLAVLLAACASPTAAPIARPPTVTVTFTFGPTDTTFTAQYVGVGCVLVSRLADTRFQALVTVAAHPTACTSH